MRRNPAYYTRAGMTFSREHNSAITVPFAVADSTDQRNTF